MLPEPPEAKAYLLRMHHDRLDPSAEVALPACIRVAYVVEGAVEVLADGRTTVVEADAATQATAAMTLRAGTAGAVIWRWELVPAPAPELAPAEGNGVRSRHAGTYAFTLDPRLQRMIRCDRVDFPPGGIAWHHIHAGPGVRCVLKGALFVASGGAQFRGTPGTTWFERGPEEVFAEAAADEPTSFVRVMVIPRSYAGRSTITYVRPEEAEFPRRQTYERYVEADIEI